VTLSVAFQESSLNVRAIGDLNPATRDYGLMQVNEANVKRFRLNRKRLVTDARYAIEAGCVILELIADDPRPYWIGLYRTGPAIKHPRSIQIAKSYHKLVIKRAQRLGYQE
jgi:soluble lytic murein transglycosylase-like protein